jgi:flagellar basal body rod protein FlgB
VLGVDVRDDSIIAETRIVRQVTTGKVVLHFLRSCHYWPAPAANASSTHVGICKREAVRMNVSGMVTDNVAELLVKILDFTITRHRILSENVNNLHMENFVPMDLPVEEFALLMECAIGEHKRSKRLLLCDTQNIKFGSNGSITTDPVIDEQAQKLLQTNIGEFLELQLKKLSENAINQKIAAELLKQKQGTHSIFSNYEM